MAEGEAFVATAHLLALTVLLHERGLVPIEAVIEEIQETAVTHVVDQAGSAAAVQPALLDHLQRLGEIAGALGAFAPRVPPQP